MGFSVEDFQGRAGFFMSVELGLVGEVFEAVFASEAVF